MSRYGDLLLKPITTDALAQLLGPAHLKEISQITPLAISNAFYEQIVLHYELDHEWPLDITTRQIQHIRGDLLEAYMAAIEKDPSRFDRGHGEIREWLLKVLAFRLKGFLSGMCTSKLSQMDNPWDFAISNRPTHRGISSEIQRELASNSTSDPTNDFRRLIFVHMKGVLLKTQRISGSLNIKHFWTELLDFFNQLDLQIAFNEKLAILFLFYRVSVAWRTN
jgi:hypothetical protein